VQINSIIDIKSSGVNFKGYGLIKSVQDATTNSGSPYFNIVLGEKDKAISCKLWDRHFNGGTVSQLKSDIFKIGTVIHAEGSVSEYRGEIQMAITNYRLVNEGEVNVEDFLQTAPESITSMQEEFEDYISEIKSPILKSICFDLYTEHKEAFIIYPAAKVMHHSFGAGLLYHTLSMLRLAKGICTQYKQINRDLVYAGIALHDLGKVIELSGYIAPDYTKLGNFLGHITIVNMFIDRKVQKMKEQGTWSKTEFEQVYELMHVITAHHGKLEYGSPVVPKILEAEVVHQIDMLDSRINMITNGLADDAVTPNDLKRLPIGYFYKTSTPSLEE
jgi:3'-5' exoribonuclease